MTTNDGWTDGRYIDELRAEVQGQRRELEELRARMGHAEGQASAHWAKGRAEGFERAKEMAARMADEECEADTLADRIRAMKDDGDPVAALLELEPNRMCECGQPESAHDERGCFAWEWCTDDDDARKRVWGPSRCTRFRPRSP
jgi:hypothetical protein